MQNNNTFNTANVHPPTKIHTRSTFDSGRRSPIRTMMHRAAPRNVPAMEKNLAARTPPSSKYGVSFQLMHSLVLSKYPCPDVTPPSTCHIPKKKGDKPWLRNTRTYLQVYAATIVNSKAIVDNADGTIYRLPYGSLELRPTTRNRHTIRQPDAVANQSNNKVYRSYTSTYI